MSRVNGLLVAFVLLQTAQPSLAAVQEIVSNDEHLHLVSASKEVSVVSSNWNKAGGGVAGFSGTTYTTYVTKGSIPISDDRFAELIEETHADEQFTKKIKASKRQQLNANTLALASIAAVLGGLVGAMASASNNNGLAAVSLVGAGAGCIGLVGAFSMDLDGKRLFTDEEAYAAIQAYNKKLDEGLQRTP